jgi:hypothetical protein
MAKAFTFSIRAIREIRGVLGKGKKRVADDSVTQ